MADYTWPFAPSRDFAPEGYDEAVEFNVDLSVARSGRVTTQSLPGARWRTTLNFPTVPVSQMVERRQLEAFFLQQRGGADRLLLWNLQTPEPLGSIRGAPVLASTVAAGASSMQVSGATAGANLLKRADAYAIYGATGWTLLNSTIAGGQLDPNGGAFAQVLTRTAAGFNYGFQAFTTAAHANKAVVGAVTMKLGTLTGTVQLEIQDGVGVVIASTTVTPTSAWQDFHVYGRVGASPAANLRLVIYPNNTPGAPGDTLFLYSARLEILAGFFQNCSSDVDIGDGPVGEGVYGMSMVSLAAGDTFWTGAVNRSIAAGEAFTGSVWLKSGTLGGDCGLSIYDASFTLIASQLVTPTGSWQRFSLTATMGATSAITFMVNPVPAASAAGQTMLWFGAQLEPGGAATAHYRRATVLRGDRLGIAAQRVVAVEDAQADPAGALAVSFQPAHRLGAGAATAVVWQRPATRYVLAQPVVQMAAQGGVLPGFAVDLVEE